MKLVATNEGSCAVTDIESRLARLEDIEEIKQLKANIAATATKDTTLTELQVFSPKTGSGMGGRPSE